MRSAEKVERFLRLRFGLEDDGILAKPVPFRLADDKTGIDIEGWQTSVYHPALEALALRSRHHGLIVAPNTYLSSFAYNLIASWDYYFDGNEHWKTDPAHRLARALRLHFKKFFAEQILRRTHNLFGIAIFLETLLYEEEIMYPVLAKIAGAHFALEKASHPSKEQLQVIANWMTGLVLRHELGHVFDDEIDNFRDAVLRKLAESVEKLGKVWGEHPENSDEFLCDAFAVAMTLQHPEGCLSREEAYRLTILGFAAFAALHALDLSAHVTAKESPGKTEDPDRGNVLSSMTGASYSIGAFEKLQRDRAQAVRLLVEAMAEAGGAQVYGSEGRFQIPPTIVEDFETFLPTIVEGTDLRVRGKCEMLARALHGHQEGINYLVWRSKTYSGGAVETSD